MALSIAEHGYMLETGNVVMDKPAAELLEDEDVRAFYLGLKDEGADRVVRVRDQPNVLAIVPAGGEGRRLSPLTAGRAKLAAPFGGNYRLIDFVLSNLVNGGYLRIVVLTQYKSHSLDRQPSRRFGRRKSVIRPCASAIRTPKRS